MSDIACLSSTSLGALCRSARSAAVGVARPEGFHEERPDALQLSIRRQLSVSLAITITAKLYFGEVRKEVVRQQVCNRSEELRALKVQGRERERGFEGGSFRLSGCAADPYIRRPFVGEVRRREWVKGWNGG